MEIQILKSENFYDKRTTLSKYAWKEKNKMPMEVDEKGKSKWDRHDAFL